MRLFLLLSILSIFALVTSSKMSGNYMVIFKSEATDEEIQKYITEVGQAGGEIGHRYETVLKGFSAKIPEAYLTQLQSNLQSSPIDYIEADQEVRTQ